MSNHAFLPPSASYRWLHCTAAPHLEKLFPDVETVYTKEGAEAHNIAELIAASRLLQKTYALPLHAAPEMIEMAKVYTNHLGAYLDNMPVPVKIGLEIEVDLSNYAPGSFGTCDCAIAGYGKAGTPILVVTDYKYGRGVPVKAENNTQLMLYALGLTDKWKKELCFSPKHVIMCIDQPRLNSYETFEMSAKSLLEWGESIKPTAREAFTGPGVCVSGDWCRFCRARGSCKAVADTYVSVLRPFLEKSLMSREQTAVVLEAGADLVNWYNDVKGAALKSVLQGETVPGWKAVASRGKRVWTDEKEAIEKLESEGFAKDFIYDTKPKTLAQLEKAIGKKKFYEIVGDFVTQQQGAPALVKESDPREALNSAVADFQDVANH